ncbi:hypothetical protein PEL8287_00470 [Roseovarius litorisediminis]|uniref:Uncharacterized protein n=1 Tax=Roseovarius litorisediminis TaxID=1312363 RepID=A0A1Y5RCG2_9RHOB|nr:hypothetical protein [Roseovarius litorisediminis]SLN12991.1 hypothetical protein PEL8287_00470 [Roseovarius litorisediminis]
MKHVLVLFTLLVPQMAPAQSNTAEEGLAAWDRIYQVTSSPRCANCHVGDNNIPMWSGPSYGSTRPHGMYIDAGPSRIGAEFIPCSTCHVSSDRPNLTPHSAPHIAGLWHLAPVEAEWFGKSSNDICTQLRDLERNGGRTAEDLVDHAAEDAIVAWGWTPGGTRVPAPFSQAEHVTDMRIWGAAGQPCPGD